jgi:recombination protein RecA
MGFGKKKEEQKAPKVVIERPATDTERFKNLFALGARMDKKFETTNSLIRLGEKNIVAMPHVPFNLPTFDLGVMGIGGIPDGRVIEIFGPESAGKTTSTLWYIAQGQAVGKLAAFVDAEHALDPNYAKQLGVDVDNLLISQPDYGEQALEIVDELVKSKCVDIVVIDSAAALTPKAELAGEMGDSHPGLRARMIAQALRKITGLASKNGVTIVFTNQITEKIGVMFGNPETTPGGRALRHYSSVRIDIRRKEPITVDGEIVGHQTKMKAVKNKVATPLKETVVDLYYPNTRFTPGFDTVGDLITYASNKGLFEMSGSWYSLDGERLANGLANLKETLRDEETIIAKLRKKVLALKPESKVTV